MHDPVLTESTVNPFCGNVVMHVCGTKWEKRREKAGKIMDLRQEKGNEQGMVWFDQRAAGVGKRLVRLADSFSSYGLGLARSIENWDRSYSG